MENYVLSGYFSVFWFKDEQKEVVIDFFWLKDVVVIFLIGFEESLI